MEYADSRKRPFDGDTESGDSKRSNQGHADVFLKVLIPSIAAGAVIGKGGETISQIQKDTGTNVKMSKGGDYYPGTTERVCLISGTLKSVSEVNRFIMKKVLSKPDPTPQAMSRDGKINAERHKQVKILVANSTAGMIIGKAGDFIKQIQQETGSHVQISQKSKEMTLQERCVTISGELNQNAIAVEMIIEKISKDPHSGCLPNISYQDVQGPVASASPTGSPFAPPRRNLGPPPMGNFVGGAIGGVNAGMNNLNLNLGRNSMEQMRMVIRNNGYGEQAADEICGALLTLANYGLLDALSSSSMAVTNMSGPDRTMASLLGILAGGGNSAAGNLIANSIAAAVNSSKESGTVFGPLGSTTTTMSAVDGETAYPFGWGRGNNSDGNFVSGADKGETISQDIEVGEHIVGAILGPGGKGIVELQRLTGTSIQISKRGVYAPGTQNRIVSVSGPTGCVQQARNLVQQCITREEAKRSTQPKR